jgi:hypothetical protein
VPQQGPGGWAESGACEALSTGPGDPSPGGAAGGSDAGGTWLGLGLLAGGEGEGGGEGRQTPGQALALALALSLSLGRWEGGGAVWDRRTGTIRWVLDRCLKGSA